VPAQFAPEKGEIESSENITDLPGGIDNKSRCPASLPAGAGKRPRADTAM